MSNHDDRGLFHRFIYGGLNLLLAFCVQGAGGFVKENDPGIPQKRPGDGNPLAASVFTSLFCSRLMWLAVSPSSI